MAVKIVLYGIVDEGTTTCTPSPHFENVVSLVPADVVTNSFEGRDFLPDEMVNTVVDFGDWLDAGVTHLRS